MPMVRQGCNAPAEIAPAPSAALGRGSRVLEGRGQFDACRSVVAGSVARQRRGR